MALTLSSASKFVTWSVRRPRRRRGLAGSGAATPGGAGRTWHLTGIDSDGLQLTVGSPRDSPPVDTPLLPRTPKTLYENTDLCEKVESGKRSVPCTLIRHAESSTFTGKYALLPKNVSLSFSCINSFKYWLDMKLGRTLPLTISLFGAYGLHQT